MLKHIVDLVDCTNESKNIIYDIEIETAKEIIDLLANKGYIISEAVKILDYCKEALQCTKITTTLETNQED